MGYFRPSAEKDDVFVRKSPTITVSDTDSEWARYERLCLNTRHLKYQKMRQQSGILNFKNCLKWSEKI
ncbi:MAG: hypothetical protein LBN95_00150 [Prevotellaceae bacterium]|nr:hypothetical protein [Prevotellaceae bacterium]